MENTNQMSLDTKSKFKLGKSEYLALGMAAFLMTIAVVLLIKPAVSKDNADYNALIKEMQVNSAQWVEYNAKMEALETRNDEIRAVICESGACDFQ